MCFFVINVFCDTAEELFGYMVLYIFRICRDDSYDRSLVHAIESVIIDWTHQIKDVLKRDSAQPLLEGLNPGPNVEIQFWKAKCENLDCIFQQVYIPFICFSTFNQH